MAKLIFTSRYIRDAPPEHLQNYVRYISTREGVEKVDESKKHLPATSVQKNLILQLLKDMPESKDMLEYEDYHQHPTIGNASEFITQALERNLDMAAMKENYVDYLANRPRVERIGEHGLFTDAGKPVILADVQKEVSEHKGPVWTHVVSLRREDAARLGYDSAREWMTLLRSKRAMLCKYMKIDSADLRWYAAFHNGDLTFRFLSNYKVLLTYDFNCNDENEAEAESFSKSCVEDIRKELERKGYHIEKIKATVSARLRGGAIFYG